MQTTMGMYAGGEERLSPTQANRLAQLRDPTTEYFQTSKRLVYQFLQKQRQEKEELRAKNRVHVDAVPSSADVNWLERRFDYRISGKAAGLFFHSSFAEAFARCMSRRVTDTKTWKGEEIIVLEGDVKELIARSAKWMHVCRFGFSSEARAKYREEQEFIARTKASKNERMKYEAVEVEEQLVDGDGINVCISGHECRHEADTVIVMPKNVQPGARQVAQMVLQHDASRAKGWFFFVPGMLSETQGYFLDGKFRYVVDMEDGLVSVYPYDSDVPFTTYHMMNMLSFMRNRTFEIDGQTFLIEMHGSDDGVMNWLMTRAPVPVHLELEDNDFPLWDSTVTSDSVLMSFLTHIPGMEDKGAQRVMLRTHGSLVERVVARLMTMDESKITQAAARIALRDYSDQYVELGNFVKLPKGLDGMLFEFVARGCHRRAKFAKVTMMVEEQLNKGAYKLADQSLVGSYVSGLMTVMKSTGKALLAAMTAPVTEVLSAAQTESWDVTIVKEDPVLMAKVAWDPEVRGVSVLGLDGPLIARRSASVGRRVVRQAWDWFKREGEKSGNSDGVVKEEVSEFERRPAVNVLGEDREKLCQTLSVAYDASSRVKPTEFGEEFVGVSKPHLTPAVSMDDPYSAAQEDFDLNFPGVALCDLAVRPYLAAVSDREYSNAVAGLKARATEAPPKKTVVMETVMKSGLSGPRPMTMAEVGAAFGKRVGGAPDYQDPRVSGESAQKAVDRFARVCFKAGWQEEVKRRVADGLWTPRESSVRNVVSKMAPGVVSKASKERFSYGDVIMTEYKAMFKRQPKDKLDSAVAFEHAPCQTIMYQENKSTNALFSSLLGEVHDLLDAILRPGMLVNMRRDKDFAEKVWNATAKRRKRWCKQVLDADISQCDKSQTAFNLSVYFALLRLLGMPDDVAQYWELVIGKKRAVATEVSFVVEFLAQVLSGLFATISMNSIIVAIATVEAAELEPEELLNLLVSGDDVVVALAARKGIQRVADRYASMYNFEVKVFEPEVLYWCGRYIVEVGGYEYFVKDPEKAFSSLAKDQPVSYAVEEAFESFVDDTRAYAWEEILLAVAKAVQVRHGRKVPPVKVCRCISTVRRSLSLFSSRFKGKRELIM